MIARIVLIVVAIVALIALGIMSMLFAQGSMKPDTAGEYVALGSSFAAGIGMGTRAPDSPWVCMRSTNGYPSLLARKINLRLVDMTCSGSTTTHVLHGGQLFLAPQIDAVGPAARLVTITAGGNDVGYVGDLMAASGNSGLMGRLFPSAPEPIDDRAFGKVTDNLVVIVREVRRFAPRATVALISYPTVVPPVGVCRTLGIGAQMASLSRQVATRLSDATRIAVDRTRAVFVDVGALSAGHDACASEPWINGALPKPGTPFHPTQAGAQAVADAAAKAIEAELSLWTRSASASAARPPLACRTRACALLRRT